MTDMIAYRLADPLWQYYLFALLALYPAIRIFKRAGLNPVGVWVLLLPWVGFMALAVRLAFTKWPSMRMGLKEGNKP